MIHVFLDWKSRALGIIADKAYGGGAIRQQIAEEGALCVVPAKSNARNPAPHNANVYAMRNIVDRFFCKMKDMRRLSAQFEKYAQNLIAMRHIFAIKCWIN